MARRGRCIGHGDIGEVVLADGFDCPSVYGVTVSLPAQYRSAGYILLESLLLFIFFSALAMSTVDVWVGGWTYRLRRQSLGYTRRSLHSGRGMAGVHGRERRRVCSGSRSRRIGGFYQA